MNGRVSGMAGWAVAAILAACIPLSGRLPQAPTQEPKKPTYEELVEKAKKGDPGVDFAALRFKFLEAPGGHKEGFFNSRQLNDLAQQKDYENLLKTANDFVALDFVDIRGHFYAGVALHVLGREDESQKEMALANALVKSILDSGDGKTQKTAYVVINVSEEYALLEWLGVHANQQALMTSKDGPICDLLTGTKNGQAVSVYFDITKFYGKKF